MIEHNANLYNHIFSNKAILLAKSIDIYHQHRMENKSLCDYDIFLVAKYYNYKGMTFR